MSRFAKNFHLTCAIVASLTCVVMWVVVGIVLFHWRTITPPLDPVKVILFLIPSLVIGAGAQMEFSFYKEERNGKATNENRSVVTSYKANTGVALITTVPRALAAIAFTLWMYIQGMRSLLSMRPYSLPRLFPGLLPHWAVVITNIAFYGFLAWTAVNFARAALKKEEKGVLLMVFAVLLLNPIGVLLPKTTLPLRFLQALFDLVALLASVSLLLSLHKDRGEPGLEERS